MLQEAEVGNDGLVALLDPADSPGRAYRRPLSLTPNPTIAASPTIKAMLAEPSAIGRCLGDLFGGTPEAAFPAAA